MPLPGCAPYLPSYAFYHGLAAAKDALVELADARLGDRVDETMSSGSHHLATCDRPAMIWRASRNSSERNPSEKPRTPERAPTPAATPWTTNANLTAEARVSRLAMRAAVNQKLGMGTKDYDA